MTDEHPSRESKHQREDLSAFSNLLLFSLALRNHPRARRSTKHGTIEDPLSMHARYIARARGDHVENIASLRAALPACRSRLINAGFNPIVTRLFVRINIGVGLMRACEISREHSLSVFQRPGSITLIHIKRRVGAKR